MNEQEFINELKKLNIELKEEQLKKLNDYQEILLEYNKHTNLTAIRDKESVYLKHFYDSLTLKKYINDNDIVLDIGTGAGFPGMVLAIVCPYTSFILLDSNNKKIKFLEYLNDILKLNNIKLIHDRAENYISQNKEKFDIVTSRAVASLSILAEISIPALKINGYFIPLKANIKEEINDLESALPELNAKLITKEEFNLPKNAGFRTILKIKHTAKTKDIYPRSYDKIRKKPLKKNNK